ncbi:hypothetical protein AVEN_39707-1 [Araneus ventricosus]|uniref:Uncharacterized protein n=1 Tax=Araneus ventricosus TaxID=182803 RepID=A0A4Y2LXA9_ARAVE|nr:hypothetical protein AVEN_39707-1 [Araneus ventricosus]
MSSKRGNSPCFEDDGNDHLFISLEENPPKRFHWGPAMMYTPETRRSTTHSRRHTGGEFNRAVRHHNHTAAPQPPTAVTAGSNLGRDQRRRAYKMVGSWENLCGTIQRRRSICQHQTIHNAKPPNFRQSLYVRHYLGLLLRTIITIQVRGKNLKSYCKQFTKLVTSSSNKYRLSTNADKTLLFCYI